jgi:hypothetical protein
MKKWPRVRVASHFLKLSFRNRDLDTVVIQYFHHSETLRRPHFFCYVDYMRMLTETQDGQVTVTASNNTVVNNTMTH